MVKYILKVIKLILSKIYLIFIVGSIALLYIFSCKETYFNIINYDKYDHGIINSFSVERTDMPDQGAGKDYYVVKIKSGNELFTANLKINTKFKLGDNVKYFKKGTGVVKILTINNNRINTYYGFFDLIYLIITLLPIVIIIIKTKMKKKWK